MRHIRILPDVAYTTPQASEAIHSSPRTMEDWRIKGTGPAFVRLGKRRVIYMGSALLAWLDQQTRTHTNQKAA